MEKYLMPFVLTLIGIVNIWILYAVKSKKADDKEERKELKEVLQGIAAELKLKLDKTDCENCKEDSKEEATKVEAHLGARVLEGICEERMKHLEKDLAGMSDRNDREHVAIVHKIEAMEKIRGMT